MKEAELKEKISGHIKTLIKNKGIYVICPRYENYQEAIELILTQLITKNKQAGIYIKLGEDYLVFHERLKTVGIDVSELFFIYCHGREMERFFEAANCTFISSPRSLTELSLAITTSINSGKFDFLLFDSIIALLAYNTPEVAEKFINYVIAKLRNYGIAGIIISSKDEAASTKLATILAKLCDTVVE